MATIFPKQAAPQRDVGSLTTVLWDTAQRGFAEVLVGRDCTWEIAPEEEAAITIELDHGSGYGAPVPVDMDDTVKSASALIARINAETGTECASITDDGTVAIRAPVGVRLTGATSAIFQGFGTPVIERRTESESPTFQLQSITDTSAIDVLSLPLEVPEEARRVSLFGTVGPGIDGPDEGGVTLLVVWGNGVDNETIPSLRDMFVTHVPHGEPVSMSPDSPLMQSERFVAALITTPHFQRVLDVPPWGKTLRIIPISTASKTRRPGVFSARVGFAR